MSEHRLARNYLLGASALSIILSFIPFAGFLVYPFKLFVTFIHEGGHALATVATMGDVDRIVINPDTSGLTLSAGGMALIIASAGYLTSTLYGAALLLACRNGKNAKAGLGLSAALILGMTVVWTSGLFGWIVGIVLTAGLIFFAVVSNPRVAHFFLSFLAVQCCLNALYDLRTLFLLSATTGASSDAMNMQRMTMVPAVVWAVLWLGLSLVVLWLALRRYFERSRNMREDSVI
ncbi:MAG TPA: M50 family metallopeptidase [Blastocatellia bacterium]|nr:M50 family metallopeptidase [Blastocatellia bacterium]